MNLSFKGIPNSKAKETVLFVCIENAGRSQMVEAFFRKYPSHTFCRCHNRSISIW
jgi:arsenate reductase (thioredoxin)